MTELFDAEPLSIDELLSEAEVLLATKTTALPKMFVDAVLNQKKGDGPRVIAVCPTLSREDFIKTLPENHPARKKERGGE